MIVGAVHELMPKEFLAEPKKAEFPPPKSPEEALAAFHTKVAWSVELAAAEPLVVDPVAIDWGADGKLWVVEMRDYPMGLPESSVAPEARRGKRGPPPPHVGGYRPGGRIKFLEDLDGDGKYDQATVFLEGLPFPTGVTAWGKGVLVCAAPDIIYAEDTDGDGKADVVTKLFTGFATENYQARVNSLSLGLDNWLYGANGLIGGRIRHVGQASRLSPPGILPDQSLRSEKSRPESGKAPPIDISGRDFRMHPDTGQFEPAAGLTQQGRVRDDWGNWFGCDNSTLLWHYPLPDHYVRRNPHVPPPEPRVFVPADSDPNQLFPTSRILERFNDPGAAGRTTSACGLCIYRDDLLGTNYYGNAFVCEPVHNLVHRLVLRSDGVTFKAYRAPDEEQNEFLSSKDNWFRPVQARTGPDGALWIVDMYRFVVEHPRWIPPERLAKLDVRAGDDKGRIYRVYPSGKKLRPIPDLTKLSTTALAYELKTHNGTVRDLIHLELVRRNDPEAVETLERIAGSATLPAQVQPDELRFSQNFNAAARLQALCILGALKKLPDNHALGGLGDGDPAVRRHAIRLCEAALRAPSGFQLMDRLCGMASDPDRGVRYQLALSLGECQNPIVAQPLGELLLANLEDKWMRAAVASSSARFPAEILKYILTRVPAAPDSAARREVIDHLIATAAGSEREQALDEMLPLIAPPEGRPVEPWQLTALGSLLDSLRRAGRNVNSLSSSSSAEARAAVARIKQALADAVAVAQNESVDEATRAAAIALLGRNHGQSNADLDLLRKLLAPETPGRLQTAALEALARTRNPKVPELLLADWNHDSPSLRNAILGALLARDEWIGGLLDAIEKRVVAPAEIPPVNRQRLLKHGNELIRKRASALLAGNPSGSRAEVLAKYQSVMNLTGDPGRGEAAFAKACSTCHAFGGQGHAVGPDLTAFRAKSPQDFLVAILDPNAAIEPRFINYQIETKDGRSLSGVVKAETSTSLTLAQSGGLEEKILRNDIAEIKASGLSLMPEGLEQSMTPQELADLIAYVKHSLP